MRILTKAEMQLILGGGADTEVLEPIPVPNPQLPPVSVDGPSTPDPAPVPPVAPPPSAPLPPINSGGGQGGTPPPPPPPNPCYAQSSVSMNWVNYAYTRNHEGGVLTTGYVPGGGSGVTIGAGVDLAFRLSSELISWGIPAADILTLSPYLATGPGNFGPRGSVATALLQANGGLSLTSAGAERLTSSMEYSIHNSLVNSFDSRNALGMSFNRLPAYVQTVTFDAAYQMGINGLQSGTGANFYSALLAGNFAQATNELTVLGINFDRRYADNAALMSSLLGDGTIPSQASGLCK